MKNNTAESANLSGMITIPSQAFLEHWQGHRRVTRRMIEAFPEDKLFTYSVGGMRPFSDLTIEMIGMAGPGVHGILTGDWKTSNQLLHHSRTHVPKTKDELLRAWDEVTAQINSLWPQIPPKRFAEIDKAFGEWEGPLYGSLQYWIDNEIHHRGQGYVYLRSLGIEPPAFYDRS